MGLLQTLGRGLKKIDDLISPEPVVRRSEQPGQSLLTQLTTGRLNQAAPTRPDIQQNFSIIPTGQPAERGYTNFSFDGGNPVPIQQFRVPGAIPEPPDQGDFIAPIRRQAPVDRPINLRRFPRLEYPVQYTEPQERKLRQFVI